MRQSDSIGNLASALAKAQGQMRLAIKDAQNPHLKNKYADLTSVWDACRQVLADNELSVSQLPSTVYEEGQLVLNLATVLMHSSGEWIGDQMSVAVVGNRGVNDLQAMGSAITYLRRYALSAIVGVATGDDDDGDGAQVTGRIRQELVTQPKPANGNGHAEPGYSVGQEVMVAGKNDEKAGTVLDFNGAKYQVQVGDSRFWTTPDRLTAVPVQSSPDGSQD